MLYKVSYGRSFQTIRGNATPIIRAANIHETAEHVGSSLEVTRQMYIPAQRGRESFLRWSDPPIKTETAATLHCGSAAIIKRYSHLNSHGK
jgi:hypothetical protein